MYIITDAGGRVIASAEENVLVGAIEVQAPEGFAQEEQGDWVLDDGELVYLPLPRGEVVESDPLADLAEMVVDNTIEIELIKLQMM